MSDSKSSAPARALSEVLRAAAEEQPILIQVDDAEWLDSQAALIAAAVLGGRVSIVGEVVARDMATGGQRRRIRAAGTAGET
ncbi:MAG: hypothetical protein ACE5HF_03870 [Gemmatimonadota bacterium]